MQGQFKFHFKVLFKLMKRQLFESAKEQKIIDTLDEQLLRDALDKCPDVPKTPPQIAAEKVAKAEQRREDIRRLKNGKSLTNQPFIHKRKLLDNGSIRRQQMERSNAKFSIAHFRNTSVRQRKIVEF